MTTIEETIKHFEALQKRYIKTHNGKMCEKVHIALSALKENAELKARLENSIELPCKVGDTVYVLTADSLTGIEETIINRILCRKNKKWIFNADCVFDDWGSAAWEFKISDFGKIVFSSIEEAEAVKEREENDN